MSASTIVSRAFADSDRRRRKANARRLARARALAECCRHCGRPGHCLGMYEEGPGPLCGPPRRKR